MKRYSLIAIAAATLAAGCSFQPRYERPAAPVAAAFPASGVYATQPTTSAGDTAAGRAAVDIGWREFFADPRLQQIIQIALENNRDLRVSVLNVDAARAQYRVTRAQLFPAINAQGSKQVQRVPADLSPSGQTISQEYQAGFNASWEIDFWGRIRSLKDQALEKYLATAQARKAAEISLVSQVAQQYLQMLAVDDLLKITDDTLKTAEASYSLTKLQFENGTGSELDLRQAETIVEQARANRAAQARARAQAENALVLLIGEPLPDDLPPGRSLEDQRLLTDIPAGLPSDLLTRRPDIMQAEATLRAANANIGAARAAFFPRISLTSSVGSASPTLGGLFKAGSAAWTFAPQITLPIFEGGQNLANLDLANVQKRIEIANYEKAIQSAFREVADGLAARSTYDEQIRSLERTTFAQSRTLDLSQLRYKNGVDSYLQVLTAQTNLYSVQQSLVNARVARLDSLVSLYVALGGGWIANTGDTPRPADAPAMVGAASAPVGASAASKTNG
ncbi:multidrug transporter [Trinickia dabaoshanensis]|uniref:Multidrug transporter n=1 Tax=Trinickia dabaoshanensis TaxID=564714 RepID=A0A2N7VJX1_9BURK|nr:efflux transporter outer membrane subunit [Trinickia dabaoshanensis]PMS17433.1 multidrug transporter [Trinickia dabaoshanensis]